jgi:glycosyltransferase involved in cell wall biosynthesis
MKIAINTRFLLSHKMEGFGWYTFEIVKRIVEKHPEHTFYFFFDRPFDPKFLFAKNVIPVVLNPPARHPILFLLWFDWAVPRALKKYNIDLFFSPDGYVSLRTSVPQVGVIHDLNFEHHPLDIPRVPRMYLRTFFPKFAKKAKHILTVSEYSKQDICATYSISPEKVTAIWNAASPVFKPLDETEKDLVKAEFSHKEDYFLFVGAIHPRKNVKTLLLAFEKYRLAGGQKKLLIVGENLWKNNPNHQLQISAEFKEAIHFTGHLPLEKLANVMGAAFCFVFIPYFEGFGIPLVEAMQSGVPIIAGNLTSLPEVLGDAGILVNPFDAHELAENMRKLENDPQLRAHYCHLALERSRLFSWDDSAEKVWQELEKLLPKKA